MHFFYLDEAGCNLRDLQNDEAPIFVLGGIIVKDKGWNKTHGEFEKIINAYFNNAVPNNFELHSHELLSPNGDGHFAGHDRARRNKLAFDLLIKKGIVPEEGRHAAAFNDFMRDVTPKPRNGWKTRQY